MRRFLAFFTVLLVTFACFPDAGRAAERPPQNVLKTKPPQSVLTTCGCPPGYCKCPAGDCGGSNCPSAFFSGRLSYADAFARAVKTGKPLLVWVGYYPVPVLADDYPDCVCCFVDTLQGYKSSLVVSKPDGQGGVEEVAVLPYLATEAQVRAALASRQVVPVFNPHQIQYTAPGMLTPRFVNPPTFMGGFGGGGRRGGGC